MILRPLDPVPAAPDIFVPAWPVIERLQQQKYPAGWMITQPSHAALSGEIAAQLAGPNVPAVDEELVRAIALHDAGWGPADAQAVTRSRAAKPVAPKSFLACDVAEFLDAWTQSIQVAQTTGPAGGYIVSRHFQRLAAHRIAHGGDSAAGRRKLDQFLAQESQRQKKLAARQKRSTEDLESLSDLLQFCDLFSLYVCCGARVRVEFPEYFGANLRVTVEGDDYRLNPSLLPAGAGFSFAALRFPTTKGESSKEIGIRIV